MGWKASCILVNERGPGHLGTRLLHDPARARRLIADLGLGRPGSRGMTTFDEGIYPRGPVVGAYDGAAILGDPRIGEVCLEPGTDPLTARVLEVFPKAAVLRLGLHSVVNLWSYAYYEGGRMLRSYGGCGDEGVMLETGDPLPEERPHFERSVVRDGRRYFRAEIADEAHEFDAPAFGEELAFEVMGRFFGRRPDQAPGGDPDPFDLAMEAFDPTVVRRRWWWPFARG